MVSEFFSFLRPNDIPLYLSTTFHSSVDGRTFSFFFFIMLFSRCMSGWTVLDPAGGGVPAVHAVPDAAQGPAGLWWGRGSGWVRPLPQTQWPGRGFGTSHAQALCEAWEGVQRRAGHRPLVGTKGGYTQHTCHLTSIECLLCTRAPAPEPLAPTFTPCPGPATLDLSCRGGRGGGHLPGDCLRGHLLPHTPSTPPFLEAGRCLKSIAEHLRKAQ